jgi:steroid 5-alpha reductase family enzyme
MGSLSMLSSDMMFNLLALRIAEGWLAFSAIMLSAWMLWRITGNAGFVDSIWSFGISSISFALALVPLEDDGSLWRRVSVSLCVVAWGVRLGAHIWRRSRSKGNDPRYMKMIREWGSHASYRMFIFLQIQALCSVPLMLAVAVAAHNSYPEFTLLDAMGLGLAVISVCGEAIADEQLRRFNALHVGVTHAVCDIGLWRYSRHPNYFFEFLVWCSFPFFALSGYQFFSAALALAGPLCMYWLLVYVSGIPPLEDHMINSRGQAYRVYQERTNSFFPLPPRA